MNRMVEVGFLPEDGYEIAPYETSFITVGVMMEAKEDC